MNFENQDEFMEADEEYLDEQIKEKLSNFKYIEYEDEKNDEYVYEFKDLANEKLLIVVDDRATIYYADSHCHYEFYKDDIDALIDETLDIFNGRLKVVKFYSSKRWLGNFWVSATKSVQGVDFLEEKDFPKEFINEFKRLGGEITETYWSKGTVTQKIDPIK